MPSFRNTSIAFIVLLAILTIATRVGLVQWWWILVLVLVYVHALVLGSIYINANFYVQSLNKGKDNKLVALTFDDGPAAETNAILDILKEQNVQAAFFTIGKKSTANPELVKRWHNEGHVIGNHSYNHGFNFDWQSARTMGAEIEQTNSIIHSLIGKKPKLFRPPYGVTNPNLAKAIKQAGMFSIGWSIRSFDTKANDPEKLLERIINKLKGGDIILLHDSMPITREILTELIVRTRKKGFTFARVDKLLEIEAYA